MSDCVSARFVHFIYAQYLPFGRNAVSTTPISEIWIDKSCMNHLPPSQPTNTTKNQFESLSGAHISKCNLFTMIHGHNRWHQMQPYFCRRENIATISNLINSIKRFSVIAPIILCVRLPLLLLLLLLLLRFRHCSFIDCCHCCCCCKRLPNEWVKCLHLF